MQKYYLCKSINKREHINQNNSNFFHCTTSIVIIRELLKYCMAMPSTGNFHKNFFIKKRRLLNIPLDLFQKKLLIHYKGRVNIPLYFYK